jgi:mono/diheme cytochrome c family protein
MTIWVYPRTALRLALAAVFCAAPVLSAAEASSAEPLNAFKQYCFACHGKSAMGGINLQQLTSHPSLGDNFQQWRKVAAVLEQKRMPPENMPQLGEDQRRRAVTYIRAKLSEYAQQHAGDPGRVTVRRLTSGEYLYTIRDLTGLDLKLDADFATDAAGGEGFTNFGDTQFMGDATLERYLEIAKRIADHAVIGAGPLHFYDDAGRSGFELSAINRIQAIYRANGFRANSGEGGKPYGLDRYTKGYFAGWRYRHRAALGEPNATLEQIAAREGVPPRFARHLWDVMNDPAPTYPTSEIVTRWRNLPVPSGPGDGKTIDAARAACTETMLATLNWPRWLFAAGAAAEGGQGDERALVLNDEAIVAEKSHRYRFVARRVRGQKTARVFLSAMSANPLSKDQLLVIWRNAVVRFRGQDRGPLGTEQKLMDAVDEATRVRLAFGTRPDTGAIGPADFAVTAGPASLAIDIVVPEGAAAVEFDAQAELAAGAASDAVLRCIVADKEEVAKGRPVWALLGDPASEGFKTWKKNVLDYAARLPQNSQGEPTPSDKDPIPPPFNNVYNQPERDLYHVKLKYYRTDRFLVEKILDDDTRARLEHAWSDLLTSFDYHDTFLGFVAQKYKVDLHNKRIGDLAPADIEGIPAEPRRFAKALRAEYDAVQKAQLTAQPGHLEDCLKFAALAWRRPLAVHEKDRLRAFYTNSREVARLDHGKAIEALLARILVSPAFLYRFEQAAQTTGVKPLNDWELASRLSYFLWSSLPDQELRRAAAAGELSNPAKLDVQVKRMLADPKARRFATEFFGQWLGFYRFDQHRGVDAKRFPEFTDEVKSAMYDEAVTFFEHVLRRDRPVRELFLADYTFVNKSLARHYGIKKEIASTRAPELVTAADAPNRGGMLRLGAVLTATSAPLRTSPVKRGDWLLRRVLGTPTPPPPADAGSIPADEKAFEGMSIFERLESHKRNATCASCHTRIDPLGFPLEHYDAIGRWRETYSDGKPIRDNAVLYDQTPIDGINGLLGLVKSQEPQVLRTLASKMIGYGLGRTVTPADEVLIESVVKTGGDANFSTLVAEIVKSKQFRYRRERDESRPASGTQITKAVPYSKPEGGR